MSIKRPVFVRLLMINHNENEDENEKKNDHMDTT